MTKLETAIKALRAAEARAAAYGRGSNEGGGGYNPHDAEVEAALAAVGAADDEAFAATWTNEHWTAMRGRWNAAVAKLGTNVKAIEAETGLTLSDMRRAKALHSTEV